MAFYDELKKMPISLHGVLSNESAPGFENGFIDVEKISRLVPDFLERETYICGPHIMRQKLVKELEKLGVPKRHVHFEEFAF
jgi:ferredoxin-NADP reductase